MALGTLMESDTADGDGAVLAVMSDDRFDREVMGELQDVVGDSARVAPPFLIGFVGSMLALLLLAAAL